MKDISILLAFSAGLLSFLSPCVLPLVPAYISYLAGTAAQGLSKGRSRLFIIYKALGFSVGFSIVFLMMFLSITTLGKLFDQYREYIRIAGGILVIIFGLHLTGILKIKYFYYEKRVTEPGKLKSGASSILLGMAFAAGWTPCIGPILGSILLYAGNMDTVYKGMLLLVSYSIGLATPFIFTAAAIEGLSKHLRKISRYMPVLSVISGILVMGIGVIILFDRFVRLSAYFNFFNF